MKKMSESLNGWLKFYIDQKFWIFPCKPIRGKREDKSPYTPHGFKDATNNMAKAKDYWNCWPDALIGIDCGRSGIVAIDIDNKKGRNGNETWLDLETKNGMTQTWQSKTPSNGSHVIFKRPVFPPIPSYGDKWPGIDIKSEGGYICAPGNGAYKWHKQFHPTRVPLADMPDWLIDALKKNIKKRTPTHNIPQGSRNNALTSLLGRLRRNGATLEQLERAGLGYNQTRLTSPLPEREVLTIARSVVKYPTKKTINVPIEVDKQKANTSILIREGQKLDEAYVPPVHWILEEFLKPSTWVIMAAKTKQGKSYLLHQLGVMVASGLSYLGFHCLRPIKTLYLQKENTADDIVSRSQTIFDELRYMGHKLNLNNFLEATIEPRHYFLEDLRWLYDLWEQYHPELIIVDPLSRFSQSRENEKEGLSPLMDDLDRFCKTTKCCLIISHHVKKQDDDLRPITFQDIRGSTHLPASSHGNFILNATPELPSKIGISEISKTYMKIQAQLRYESQFSTLWAWRDKNGVIWQPQKTIFLKNLTDVIQFVKSRAHCTTEDIISGLAYIASRRTIFKLLKQGKDRGFIRESQGSNRQKRAWIIGKQSVQCATSHHPHTDLESSTLDKKGERNVPSMQFVSAHSNHNKINDLSPNTNNIIDVGSTHKSSVQNASCTQPELDGKSTKLKNVDKSNDGRQKPTNETKKLTALEQLEEIEKGE